MKIRPVSHLLPALARSVGRADSASGSEKPAANTLPDATVRAPLCTATS